jgi:hypothetical protein
VAAGPVVGERVFGVSVPQGMGERVLPLGDGNEMDVIGHQAIAQNACSGTRGVAGEKVQIETAVVGGEENRLTVIAALGNVMSDTGKDDAGTAGHNSRVQNRWRDSHENASVTFSPSSVLRDSPFPAPERSGLNRQPKTACVQNC